MSDPRDSDLRRSDLDARTGANSAWGWIAGAVFFIVILILAFGYGMNTNTASDTSSPPAATTGAGPTVPPASTANPQPTSPSTPANPSNGGQTR